MNSSDSEPSELSKGLETTEGAAADVIEGAIAEEFNERVRVSRVESGAVSLQDYPNSVSAVPSLRVSI